MEFLTHLNIIEVKIPQDRIQALLKTISHFLPKITVTARLFLSLLGADFVILGRPHFRPLQMSLLAQWKPHILQLHHQIKLTHNIRYHLNWWNNPQIYLKVFPSRPLFSHRVIHRCQSDWLGSSSGTGGLLFHGVWTQDQSQLHINLLEMMAITLALKQTHRHIINSVVLVSIDNTTVVAHLRQQGRTHSPDLCLEVWNTLIWCHQNNMSYNQTHSKEIQHTCRWSVKNKQTDHQKSPVLFCCFLVKMFKEVTKISEGKRSHFGSDFSLLLLYRWMDFKQSYIPRTFLMC